MKIKRVGLIMSIIILVVLVTLGNKKLRYDLFKSNRDLENICIDLVNSKNFSEISEYFPQLFDLYLGKDNFVITYRDKTPDETLNKMLDDYFEALYEEGKYEKFKDDLYKYKSLYSSEINYIFLFARMTQAHYEFEFNELLSEMLEYEYEMINENDSDTHKREKLMCEFFILDSLYNLSEFNGDIEKANKYIIERDKVYEMLEE